MLCEVQKGPRICEKGKIYLIKRKRKETKK